MPPREPGGLQLAQHQGGAEALTDPGQELAQHRLGKLPLEMEAALAAYTSWKANSSDGNTCRKRENMVMQTGTNSPALLQIMATLSQQTLPGKILQYSTCRKCHAAVVSKAFTEEEDAHLLALSYSEIFPIFSAEGAHSALFTSLSSSTDTAHNYCYIECFSRANFTEKWC